MRKRSITKFLAMFLLLAQLFSLTTGITAFAAIPGDTIPLEPRPTPTATPEPSPELTPPPESELELLPEAYIRHHATPGTISMGGDNYENSIDFALSTIGGFPTAYIFYNLDGKYSLITFDAGYIGGDARNAFLSVYGDGKLLLDTIALNNRDLPRSFTVDVAGIKQLQFAYSSEGYSTTHYGVGNLRGVRIEELDTTVYESDAFYDEPCYNLSAGLCSGEFEMGGKSYKDGYSFVISKISGAPTKTVSFNFKKQYREMTFDVAKFVENKDDPERISFTMTVEADGKVIPEYDNVAIKWSDLAFPVKLDLNGVSQVTVSMTNTDYNAIDCRMSNIQLKSDGKPHGILLDATPVTGTDNYTAVLTDETPEIPLNPRVYPSDAPRDYEMTVAEGAEYITVSDDGIVTAVHGGDAKLVFTVPDSSIEVECAVTSKVTAHILDEGTVTKEPTMTEEGEKSFSCTVCEETKTEKLDKLTECEEHIWNDGEVTKEPTYTEEGEKLLTCTVCGKTETAVVDKLTCTEHSWADGKILKEPTYTEEGEKQYTCGYCGET
ncbi:MAG: NPCBM/NEW2 domain-containing protein, partial [Clostridia bacterium]|nr:NPCBM/NEW2 domain-containing protein [Clostridia bacterium]